MCARRLRSRVASAIRFATGYVTHRRLAFHKRGKDGSAKADAVYTGLQSDCVWGVVFALGSQNKLLLDSYEAGYNCEEVVVNGKHGVISAVMYVASAAAIDASLRPFTWYQSLVLRGATEHELPIGYVRDLGMIETIVDPNPRRNGLNARLVQS